MTKRRVLVIPLITLVIMTALAAMAPAAHADGGDFSLDFIAAGPFTYNHDTGVGGEYADRTISKTEGVVESLEGGDYECGDKVVYFTQITVEDGAAEQDIELDFSFLAEPTGQPGVGHALPVSVSANTGDSGMSGATGDTTVSLLSSGIDTSGAKDQVVASVGIDNLDAGEVFILRIVLELDCIFDSTPTGNLEAGIDEGRVVAPEAEEGAIPVGTQTVPFQSLSDISQPASVSVDLGACEPSIGSSVTPVTVTITPAGAASLTVNGPNGFTHTFTGSGGSIDLAPGHYTWTATAEEGFILEGATSGSFDVADCALTRTTVSVDVGECVPSVGSSETPVTVVIDPTSGASVTVNGPNGFTHTFTGSGGTIDLAPGHYTWTATAEAGFGLVGQTSGSFDVEDCALTGTSVTVEVGECVPSVGSSVTPVTVTIDPESGAEVTVEGPNGFTHTFTGSGGTIDLAPGHYTWSATPGEGFAIVGPDSGSFDVVDCALVAASVNVTVRPCPAVSSTTKPVAVAINPDGAASVDIDGPNGYHTTVTGTGATLELAKGDYTWTATENPGFSIIGDTSGTFSVGSCVVQVLPKTILPSTGSSTTPGLGVAGFAFLLVGFVMVAVSRRTPRVAPVAGISRIASRLSGRMVWTEWTAHGLPLVLRSPGVRERDGNPRRRVARRSGLRIGRAGLGEG